MSLNIVGSATIHSEALSAVPKTVMVSRRDCAWIAISIKLLTQIGAIANCCCEFAISIQLHRTDIVD